MKNKDSINPCTVDKHSGAKAAVYTEAQLVRIAQREHNTKRSYLVVNPMQGKHVPVKPSDALSMFDDLASILLKEYKDETLLLIGFAETATAIGAAAAVYLDSYYMQTTRESLSGVDYLYFTESHSHAAEQKLVKDDIDRIIHKVDRIIFMEDEVTTGNTILKIVHILQKTYSHKLTFSVASILNGMNEAALAIYRKEQISLHYLVKTNHDSYGEIAKRCTIDGDCYDFSTASGQEYESVPISSSEHAGKVSPLSGSDKCKMHLLESTVNSCINARRLTRGCDYQAACAYLWNKLSALSSMKKAEKKERILVLGTEEFMYPALYVGEQLEKEGKEVLFHATTRSPIAVSKEANYPLHKRYALKSVYDINRKTFLYDIGQYDCVWIITDALKKESCRMDSLLSALRACGNQEINVIRWE